MQVRGRIRSALAALPALVAAGCAAVSETSISDPALARRVAELEAKEEIRAVLVDYGRLLDAGDPDAYADLFAEDGVWTGGFGTFEGREAIRGMLAGAVSGPRERLSTLHLLSNELIEVDVDAGRATALSKWFFITTGPDGAPRMAMAGRYEDELVRRDGRWLIARRAAPADIGAGE